MCCTFHLEICEICEIAVHRYAAVSHTVGGDTKCDGTNLEQTSETTRCIGLMDTVSKPFSSKHFQL